MPKPYVVGDTPLLQVTCVDEDDGAAIDITGATVTLRWSVNGAATSSGSMQITNASSGIVQRRWGASELSEEGKITFEVRIVDTDSNQFTSQEFRREIRRSI